MAAILRDFVKQEHILLKWLRQNFLTSYKIHLYKLITSFCGQMASIASQIIVVLFNSVLSKGSLGLTTHKSQ